MAVEREQIKYVQSAVHPLSFVLYVRIVDKGPGELWSLCRAWAWDVVLAFLQKEGYSPVADSAAECHQNLCSIAAKHGWLVNNKAELCKYLIGKAKSLVKRSWLWPNPNPNLALNPKPVLQKQKLKTSARAFTAFLRQLNAEVPMSFQVLGVQDVARWYWWIDRSL